MNNNFSLCVNSSLADWLAHLESLHPKGESGIELGLERMQLVKTALQQTQQCPLIIVGGTNGKGSTCAYLEAIYRAAGYRVGCYNSPHLLVYNERVRINGQMVSDDVLCAAFARVESARQIANPAGKPVALTYFEFGTLAAWEVFAAQALDVLILEVGLGGRLDAVNAYDADCAIITSIALDHTDWLGSTREAIGFEKAGIFRPGKAAICADLDAPQSLFAHAVAIGANWQQIGRDFFVEAPEDASENASIVASTAAQPWSFRVKTPPKSLHNLPQPALVGRVQRQNAAAALAATEVLASTLPISRAALVHAFKNVSILGRFQVLPAHAGRAQVILDVAHNPQAMAELANKLEKTTLCPFPGKTVALIGMLADKDIEGALAALGAVAHQIEVYLLADLSVARGAPAQRIAQAAHLYAPASRIECYASPAEAFFHAQKLTGENDRIVVCGSFYTVAAVLRLLNNEESTRASTDASTAQPIDQPTHF